MGKSKHKHYSFTGFVIKSVPFLLMMLLTAGCTRRASYPAPAPDQAFSLSERLEKIKMTDLDGRAFTLRNLAGKPVFLNFWATWCGPCKSEMASIQTVSRQLNEDIVFLAVSSEDPAKIRAYLEKQAFSFEVAHLDIPYIEAYVVTLPTTLLIDRNGRLVSEEEGFRIWTDYTNLEKLKALASKK